MGATSFEPVSWTHTTNIYEVNLRQYSLEGNFTAFIQELPRLSDMGVEVLWFMPITPIAVDKRKGTLGSYYACADYMSTNPEYGSVEDFKNLVAEAHKLGLKVIIDWVANHTGWGHVWTQTHPEYFKKNESGEFYDKNGWDDVIDLDFDNQEMRLALIEAMRFWVKECDIDGFRCDMAMLVPLDFWIAARKSLDKDKNLFWLAECEESNYHEAFDVTYTWEWMHKTEEFVQHKTLMNGLDDLLLKNSYRFPKTAFRTFFTSNHDENSWNGTEFEKYGGAALPLAVFSATWNGIPMIYSGQELPNHKRLKFFDKDEIDWGGKYGLHEFYKKLLSLRKEHPALRACDQRVSTMRIRSSSDAQVLAFIRKFESKMVLVVLNLSDQHIPEFNLYNDLIFGGFTEIFTGAYHDFSTLPHCSLSAWDYKVFIL